ncbi:MAG: hypothetical protein U0Y08_05620 [Bacteroidia bacterium]
MRKNLIVLTGKLIIILLLMSGVNFSRHYCLPTSSQQLTETRGGCCKSDCKSIDSIEKDAGGRAMSCCKMVASFLYIPVYSLYQTPSPAPNVLTLAIQSSGEHCILLEGREVSFPFDIALQGEPPGPDITHLRVFRI